LDDRLRAVINSYKSSGVPVRYTDIEEGEEWVPCKDGVRLRVFWFRPVGGRSWPTIVQRSCYPMAHEMYRVHGQELARRGYAYICQYCRGTGGSEGQWEPNINEPSDGADFIRWADGLNWVESIGYWGCSYLASTGWAITGALPAKVKSMLLSHYGTERFTSAYQSGLFRHDILTAWAMGNAGREIKADYLKSCRYRPHVEVDKALWGGELPWYREWVTNTHGSDPYWKEGFWKFMSDAPRKLKVPVCIVEGWYDHHLGSALESFKNLSLEAAAHSRLVIGCWNHGFQPCAQGKVQEHLENDEVHQVLDWFGETLLEKKSPARRVDWYVIGEDAWRSWSDIPAGQTELVFYLDAGRKRLEGKAEADREISYQYDPENPVMSRGAESLFASFQEVGSLEQPEPDYRPDVVSFLSEPLEQSVTLLGEAKVELFVKSTAEDTAFTAKLMEVTSEGKAYNIRGSIATLAYETPYVPGEVRKITVSMWAAAYQIQSGSRLRLDISSSDFPQYAIHPNLPGIWAKQESTQTACQTILTGESYPSRAVLPVGE
jgi:putative CocE/NonD family hydrolase